MTWAAALAAMGVGQAFGRGRQHWDGEDQGIGGDEIRGVDLRGGGLRGARRVKSCEVDQCICGVC